GVDGRSAGIVSDGGHGAARRPTGRPRRLQLSAHGRRRRELPHRAESRSAHAPRDADGRTLLASAGAVVAGGRDRGLGSGRDDARDEGVVEHAGRVPRAAAVAIHRMAASTPMGRRMRGLLSARLLALPALVSWMLVPGLAAPARASVYFVAVAGLAGAPEYEQRFAAEAQELQKLLASSDSEAPHVHVLSAATATRTRLTEAMGQVARDARPTDDFVLILIGHGSFDGVEYKFNLVGPDISASDLAILCNRVPARRQLIVNATSASGGSIVALQRTGRAVIAATKSGTEKNATVFARYWVQALQDPAADLDKNESISALEAFQYAERKTAEFYTSQKRLATEHPVFEDTGKGQPVRAPLLETGE